MTKKNRLIFTSDEVNSALMHYFSPRLTEAGYTEGDKMIFLHKPAPGGSGFMVEVRPK